MIKFLTVFAAAAFVLVGSAASFAWVGFWLAIGVRFAGGFAG